MSNLNIDSTNEYLSDPTKDIMLIADVIKQENKK